VHARLLPQDETRIVEELQNSGRGVLPVADAVVVHDEIEAVPALIAISRRAHRVVVANLVIAATFITTLVLWDLLGSLPLPLAVAGHEGSTVVVALNGLRLLRRSAWDDRR
jgi:cation transport ATPase